MAAPIAEFSYSVNPSNPLEVIFEGALSSNGEVITTWDWNVGDGGVSSSQVFTKTYTAAGVYAASLTVSNGDGSSTKVIYIQILDAPGITLSIDQMVRTKIPTSLYSSSMVDLATKKWQLYLQPQINPVAIADADVFLEGAWPGLANILIAELVVYDFMVQNLNNLAMQSLPGVNRDISTEEAGTGSVKSIETGPAKAEFYEDTQNNLRYQAIFLAALTNPSTGLLQTYRELICSMALRLMVTIPICKEKWKTNFVFTTQRTPRTSMESVIANFEKWL